MANSNFLRTKYQDLHRSPEVAAAVRRTNIRAILEAGVDAIPQHDADRRIQNYLTRLEFLVLDKNHEQSRKNVPGNDATSRPRALSLLREMVMNRSVRPNQNKMAASAAIVEERAARQMGIDLHYGDAQLAQRGEIAVEDVESSLDQWINYLSDPSEPYPDWFRYYVFRSILDLSEYDKDKEEFPKRSAGTIRLFPEIDSGALSYIRDIIEAVEDPAVLHRLRDMQQEADTPADLLWTKEKAIAFSRLPFAKQYVAGMQQAGEITPELRAETRGTWVTYRQGSDPTLLWASLQNKGAAWCTKGFGTAKTQLDGGDFHVYYTLDKHGRSTIPRIAIRMQENSIFEVRGVADTRQNLEGNMGDIAAMKMRELPGAEKYGKASADMKQLTAIENKVNAGAALGKDDLVFLYEIDTPIEGFGYQKDPRIAELRKTRDPEADMPLVFNCAPENIVRSPEEITIDTKAYVGPLTPGIFEQLQSVEHIYIAFPERKIRKIELELPGKSGEEWIEELKASGIKISDYARHMLRSPDFANRAVQRGVIDKLLGRKDTPSSEKETATLIRLTVADLGFPKGATTKDIYKKAEKLGLELCSAEIGPALRKQYLHQPLNEYLFIGMKQITDSDGRPRVFGLERGDDGLVLGLAWALSDYVWHSGYAFVFRLRKF